MRRITTELMTQLYNGAIDKHTNISAYQLADFFNAMEGDDTAPAYMLKFCSKFSPKASGKIHNLKPSKLKGQTFVITSAQNNTHVHEKFLASIKKYCSHNRAKLIVGKFVYNKNGFQNGTTEDEEIYYDISLSKYLTGSLTELTSDLFFCGNLNILPTAKYPLSGFENYQGSNSCIIPTSKIALQSVATMKQDNVKFLYGTGTITLKNYIQKKAGQVAESMHSYGAIVVEIDPKGTWFIRQIETDETGIFQDLNKIYTPDNIIKNCKASSLNFGDFHSEKMDYDQLDICIDMTKYFKPKNIFINDLFDMSTRNHHNIQSGHFLYKNEILNHSVEKDLSTTVNVLNTFKGLKTDINIVESNHDQALEKWLDDPQYNYRTDPKNAKIFLKLQLAKYENILNDDFILLEHALGIMQVKPNFMKVDDSFKIHDIENAVHGHIGSNGSRGNPRQFQNLNKKMNTGHTHTCSIYGNVYTAGVTGLLDMGYNKGASSWSNSHIITYSTGFRTIITTKKGAFKAK